MNLFLNTSNLQNLLLDCPNINISDTIERDCLSVLHKLHDQVNGLQLVQVVVQPLARLFNPASLAALASSQSPPIIGGKTTSSQNVGNSSNASTPSTQYPPSTIGQHNSSDVEGYTHSRSQSFVSSLSAGQNNNNNNSNNNSSLLSTTSTYMMSPDTAQALIKRLDTDRDVNWLMEIIGYGLSMPFSITGEQDSVKDCCTIYCEWLASALLPYNENSEDSKYQQLSKLVPVPIRKEPNRYARKMLSHLYNVFLQRQPISLTSVTNNKDLSELSLTAVSRQAVLCHRVLRTIENIAQNRDNLMDNDTWHHVLALLLTVNDKLLSAPTESDDIGTQLQDRISGVLFELMLLASSRSIPDASLWKTFHEMCLNWRHRPAIVDHWKRITSLLTKRIVQLPPSSAKNQVHRPNFEPSFSASSNNTCAVEAINSMSYENLSQTWYRFLNLIGNPVDLANPSIISRTDEFYHSACVANNVLDPRQHPCLNVLPQIFINSMLGLKDFIESFIGTYQPAPNILSRRTSQQPELQKAPPPSLFKLNSERPKCNAILHIFGDWLFSAALIGSELSQETSQLDNRSANDQLESSDRSESTTSVTSTSTATEIEQPPYYPSPAFSRRPSHQSSTSSHASHSANKRRQADNLSCFSAEKITLDLPLSAESFESGQAEAMAILCRIFTSKSATEDICPAYLARFYLCLQHCLIYGCGQDLRQPNQAGPIKRQLLASVLMNSTTLLQKDLDGINLLIPSIIRAIEFVFECSDKEIPIQPPPRQHSRAGSVRHGSTSGTNANSNLVNTASYDLRQACNLTLLNLLAYPFHFQDLAIRNCLDVASSTTTFGSLRPVLLKLLFVALQTESDTTNMQILFGSLSMAIHDLASNSNKISESRREDGDSGSRGRRKGSSSRNSESSYPADDTISQLSFVFNSNNGFLIKSLHVTCHLLINIWKHDNLVSLAALEVLTTIARVTATSHVTNLDSCNLSKYGNNDICNGIEMRSEYMQATKWICDYICNQCSRPPPAHSRDMHSTIVAAYQCLSVWIYNHPYLLDDDNCIRTLMEVIELGVSGQKSRSTSINPTIGVVTQTTITKGEKHMKPSSMRVREAAESLLNICLVRTGQYGPRNIALYDTVLNENDLTESFGGAQYKSLIRQIQGNDLRQLAAYKLFKYFSDDDSIIFGFFEGSNQDKISKDSVICLMRTPFGNHCWRMRFNYYSDRLRDKIIANKTQGLIKRPFHQPSASTASISQETRIFSFSKGHNKSLYFNNTAKFFPPTIENLPPNNLDKLVESLDDYVNGSESSLIGDNTRLARDLDKMNKIFSHQVLAEQKVFGELSARIKRLECEEPQPMADLEAARILVTHLGLKTTLSTLASGDKISSSFVDNLLSLDSEPVRTCDTVTVFYVRRNRTNLMEILESVRERHNVSLEFFEWLLELGQPVVVKDHSRWTGLTYGTKTAQHSIQVDSTKLDNLENDTKKQIRNQMLTSDHGGAIFDGHRMTLYWSDMCQELAFLVPHRLENIGANITICWLECPDDMVNVPCEALMSLSEQSIVGSADIEDESVGGVGDGTSSTSTPTPTPTTTTHGNNPTLNTKQMGAKLAASKSFARYFISPMKNGLFRVNVVTSASKQWLALPLVDGVTVSKGMLSSLMRESVLNLCRRRRLDADSYQSPHVKRRLKIQDICANYKISNRSDLSEFYCNLFRNNKTTTSTN